MNFTEKLRNAVASSGSLLCVGLDPVPERIPAPIKEQFPGNIPRQILEFCKRVIESTKMHTCAFKPNTAFFEAFGSDGWEVLEEVCDMVPSNRILILDAKRGDIGNTAGRYKAALFDHLNADAVTLNPLMGMETLEPFLNDAEKAVFVLAMTSNRGSADLLQRRFEGRLSLGEYIAEELSKKQHESATSIGMVTGATQPEALACLLDVFPAAHLLIPGIGSQGGSISEMEKVLKHHKGIPVFNSSRSVIYAGEHQDDWTTKVTESALKIKNILQPITEKYV